MKKILFVSAMILTSTTLCFAQSEDVKPNVVKLNPLGAFFGAANLSYERALSEKSSVVISPSFGFFKTGGFKYTTYGIGGEYRFYFSKSKTAPSGMYAGPGAGVTFGTAKISDEFNNGEEAEKTNVTGFNARAIIGHQWIWGSGFTLDLNGGIQYLNLKFKDETGSFAGSEAFSGILPSLSVAIGYNF